jgi:hypothetical protein
MPAQRKPTANVWRPHSKPRHKAPAKRSPKAAAAQAAAALRMLATSGVLTGHADRVSARIDHGLLEAASRKIGSSNTTEVVQAALAAFVAPDPFVEWLLSDKDRLPADFELAI